MPDLSAIPTNLPAVHPLRRGAALLWGLAALISMISVVVENADSRFFSSAPDIILKRYAAFDRAFVQGSRGGGLFLRFNNFVGPNAGYSTNIYFRAVYTLYPRPVLVGDPSVVINNGKDIAAANDDFHPTGAWLEEHGVHGIIAYNLATMRRSTLGYR
jgi:hypothetical protein